MTDSSRGGKKKKITYTASEEGVEKAEKALMRLGFASKSNFAESQLLSRTTVTKFFNRQPIQLDSFKKICDALKLNWLEIAGMIEEAPGNLKIQDCNTSATLEGEEVQTVSRQVTVIDRQNGTTKAVITLEGNINSVSNFKILQLILREYSGDTVEITDIQEGSIRLIVKGSQEDIQRLISRIKSGELKEVDGFPVEDIQMDKWLLVQLIVSQGAKGLNLSGVDLSDANLSGADLSSADLSGVDLSDADLSGADLSDADLSDADLSNADLSDANLSGTKFTDSNLSGTKFTVLWLQFKILLINFFGTKFTVPWLQFDLLINLYYVFQVLLLISFLFNFPLIIIIVLFLLYSEIRNKRIRLKEEKREKKPQENPEPQREKPS